MTKKHHLVIPLAVIALAAATSMLAAATGNEVEVGNGWFRFGPPQESPSEVALTATAPIDGIELPTRSAPGTVRLRSRNTLGTGKLQLSDHE